VAVAKLVQVSIVSVPLVDKLLSDENPAVSCEVISHLCFQKSQDKLMKIILQRYDKLPLQTQKAFAQYLENHVHAAFITEATAEDIVNIVRLNFSIWKDFPLEDNPGVMIFWAGYAKISSNLEDSFNIQRSLGNFLLEQARIAKDTENKTHVAVTLGLLGEMFARRSVAFPNSEFDKNLYPIVRDCYHNSQLRTLSVGCFLELLSDRLKPEDAPKTEVAEYFCKHPEEIFQVGKSIMRLFLILCFKSSEASTVLETLTGLFSQFTWQRKDIVDMLADCGSEKFDPDVLTRFVRVMIASEKQSPFRGKKSDLLLEYIKVAPEKDMVLDVLEPLLCNTALTFINTRMLVEVLIDRLGSVIHPLLYHPVIVHNISNYQLVESGLVVLDHGVKICLDQLLAGGCEEIQAFILELRDTELHKNFDKICECFSQSQLKLLLRFKQVKKHVQTVVALLEKNYSCIKEVTITLTAQNQDVILDESVLSSIANVLSSWDFVKRFTFSAKGTISEESLTGFASALALNRSLHSFVLMSTINVDSIDSFVQALESNPSLCTIHFSVVGAPPKPPIPKSLESFNSFNSHVLRFLNSLRNTKSTKSAKS